MLFGMNIVWLLILLVCFSIDQSICSRKDVSNAFIYGQESLSNDLFEKRIMVRRSTHKKNCKGDLTCLNGGKCEDDHCHCSDQFLGHDCSIARCGNNWCSQIGGKCKNKKHCQCSLRYGGPDCSGVKCNKGASAGLICFNGGTCNNESESCVCRAGYQDQGSGCLLKVCPNGDLCYSNNGICSATGCKCRTNSTHGSDCSRRTCGKSGLICHNGATCADEKHCQCLYGWTGVTCSGRKCPGFTDLICYSTTCPAPGSAPVCQCPGHAKGRDCSGHSCGEKGLACFNGGVCTESTSTCSCLAGYGGADCRAVQCPGYSNLFCYNGGCPPVGHDVEAQCICSDPYTGPDCSQVMCSHSAITCYNGGECTDGQSCTCPPGYGGINCRGLPCGSGFCYNGGDCIMDSKSGQMRCVCPGNYTLADCSAEKCSDNGLICHNDAVCEKDEQGNYICQCSGQWAGADCSATPCQQGLCSNGGYCDDDGKGKDGCVCINGWLGADCRARSCGAHGPICYNGGRCVESADSKFTCQCESPWSGPTCEQQTCGISGLVCKNSGVCSLSNIDQTTHVCNCPSGFTAEDCSAIICGTEGNACYHGGHCNETSGICNCPPPLTSDDCRGNICGAGTANSIVCQNDGICVENAEGEWSCNCTRSWTGPYCMLNTCGDESASNLMCAHEGTCIHSSTSGAFSCACPPQWTGADCSGMRCTDPDIVCYNQVDFDADVCTPKGCDCLNDGYGADCRGVRCGLDPGRCYNGATCLNSFNGTCSPCPPGVTGSDCSMTICSDVKSGYCFNGGICVGGTTCLCGSRSEWSGIDCSEKRCSGGYRCFNGGSCNKNATQHTCICPPQYEGVTCEKSIKH